jgi:predicted MFS family arabinose efflux permease
MWEQYRRTFIPTQLFVAAACATVYFTTGRAWLMPAFVFVIMQLGFVAGAAFAARAARKMRATPGDEPLPLRRRRSP